MMTPPFHAFRATTRFGALCIGLILCAARMPAEPAPAPAEGRPVKYILVVRPGVGRGEEPDVKANGGRELARWSDRRIIEIPLPALDALRRHAAVEYMALLDEGVDTDAPKYVFGVHGTSSSRRVASSASAGPPEWQSGAYEYDKSGNITAIGTDSFTYDRAQRLASAVVGGGSIEYTYDSFGNQVSRQIGSETVTSPLSTERNRLDYVAYDRAGNQVSGMGDSFELRYDALNMVTQRWAATDGAERYVYTADDERIGAKDGNEWTWTIRGFDGRLLSTFETYLPSSGQWENAAWHWNEDHTYRDGAIVTGIKVEELSSGPQGRHFHLDHLGTPRLITNGSGYKIALHDYHPFGKEQTRLSQERTDWEYKRVERVQFTGHERDYVDDRNDNRHDYLDYMHARYYDPGLGRFLSVDPARSAKPGLPQSWNRYVYARNNPLRYVDPDGMAEVDFHVYAAPARSYSAATFAGRLYGGDLRMAMAGHHSFQYTDGRWAKSDLSRSLSTSGSLVVYYGHSALSRSGPIGLDPVGQQRASDVISTKQLTSMLSSSKAAIALIAGCSSSGCVSGPLASSTAVVTVQPTGNTPLSSSNYTAQATEAFVNALMGTSPDNMSVTDPATVAQAIAAANKVLVESDQPYRFRLHSGDPNTKLERDR